MGVEIDVVYEGDLHCQATHLASGARVATDAPKDNQGRGESFSPTDLVATALGSCMVTIMGIYAKKNALAIEGTKVRVVKDMVADPVRRIGKLTVKVDVPRAIDEKHRQGLEEAARGCPVCQSLSPQVQRAIEFVWTGAQSTTSKSC